MIFNEHQYITTKAKIKEFIEAILNLKNNEDIPVSRVGNAHHLKYRLINNFYNLTIAVKILDETIHHYHTLESGSTAILKPVVKL